MARKGGQDRGLFERPKGSGIWWIRYHDHLGKERRRQIGPKTAARRVYRQTRARIDQYKRGLISLEELLGRKKCPTLAEYLKTLEPELRQKKSWRDDRRYMENWIRLIGDLPLDEVGQLHANKRRAARLERGKAPATINREAAFLKRVLFTAKSQGVIDRNPLAGYKLLKENNIQDRYLTYAEEDRVKAVMNPIDFELVAVAVDAGLRRGEQFGLAWPDVNFDDGWIVVQESKSGLSRSVPFTERVEKILRRRFKNRTGAWVFPNQSGSRHLLPSEFIKNVFKPALKAADIEGITWHKLRHTCGTRLAQNGVSEGMIGAILGHSSNKTTKRYIHHHPDHLKKAISSLNRDSGHGHLKVVK